MQQVHKLHRAHLKQHNHFVDTADKDVVEEVGNNTDDKTADGGDHCLVDAGRKQLDVNILVTGHAHQPKIEQVEDVLLLNPGSPIVPRLADRTVMLLEINDKNVDVEIVKIGAPVCSALDFSQYPEE